MSRRKSRTRRYWILPLVLVLLLSLLPMGCFQSAPAVATYNGGSITKDEFEKQFAFQRKLADPSFQETDVDKRQFLEEYITLYKVLAADAKKAGITIDESTLPDQVQQYKDQVTQLAYGGDQAKFEAALKQYKITDDDILDYVREDACLSKYHDSKVAGINTISDEEVSQFFDQHKANFTSGTLSHILVKTEDEAKKVKDRLAKEDFATVAKDVSIDPTAKSNGGRLENVRLSEFEPAFFNEASTIELNKISDPVQTAYGFEILRVEKRNDPKFADVKADVKKEALYMKQSAAWDDICVQAQKAANIQLNL